MKRRGRRAPEAASFLGRWAGRGVWLLAMLAWAGCHPNPSEAPGEPLPVAAVRVGEVEARTTARTHGLPGTVYPSEEATVASKIMGVVARAEIEIGDKVSAGEVLLELSADELTARLEQAEAALAQVERNYEREKSLLEQGATRAEAVRTLEDELRLAEARLREARTLVGYTIIRAPFAGTITRKAVLRGDLATPGAPLLELEGTAPRRVHVQVPDSLFTLERGAPIELRADGSRLLSHLAEWSPAADPASRSRLAKLDLEPGTEVRSGQYVEVRWPAGAVTHLWVPTAALSPMGQIQRVFVVDADRAQLRLVRTGRTEGKETQILSGLNDGEQVVLAPDPELRDQQPVKRES